MPSAFDLIGHNPALLEHWVHRFLAALIDGLVVAAIYLLFVLPVAFLGLAWYVAGFLYGVIWLGYSVLLEALFGGVTQGDPRQRLFDRLARTTVTRVDQAAYMEEQFRMMQHAGPHPMTMPQAPPPKTNPPPAPGSPQAAQAAPGSWPGQGTGWPGAAPAPSTWPQHQWDEQGRLVKEMKFCTACGGQLAARGDGKLACVRCGAVY